MKTVNYTLQTQIYESKNKYKSQRGKFMEVSRQNKRKKYEQKDAEIPVCYKEERKYEILIEKRRKGKRRQKGKPNRGGRKTVVTRGSRQVEEPTKEDFGGRNNLKIRRRPRLFLCSKVKTKQNVTIIDVACVEPTYKVVASAY